MKVLMPDYISKNFVSMNRRDLEKLKNKPNESPKEPTKESPNVAANDTGREPEWGTEGGVHMRLSPQQTLKRWDRLCSVMAEAGLSTVYRDDRPEGVAEMQKRIAKMVKSHLQGKPLSAKAKPASKKR
jgi:hypothetical protein